MDGRDFEVRAEESAEDAIRRFRGRARFGRDADDDPDGPRALVPAARRAYAAEFHVSSGTPVPNARSLRPGAPAAASAPFAPFAPSAFAPFVDGLAPVRIPNGTRPIGARFATFGAARVERPPGRPAPRTRGADPSTDGRIRDDDRDPKAARSPAGVVRAREIRPPAPVGIPRRRPLPREPGFEPVALPRATVPAEGPPAEHPPGGKIGSALARGVANFVNVRRVDRESPARRAVRRRSPPRTVVATAASALGPRPPAVRSPAEPVRFRSRPGAERDDGPVSPGRNATAQILRSLSRPKIVPPPVRQHPPVANRRPAPATRRVDPEDAPRADGSPERKRQIHGDPNTAPSADDASGTEERPPLADDSPPHRRGLRSVLLDHTYAVSPRAISASAANGTGAGANSAPPAADDRSVDAPAIATRPAPFVGVGVGVPSSALPNGAPSASAIAIATAGSAVPRIGTDRRREAPPRDDDDAASVLSSVEGDRDRDPDAGRERHDSDTETAPEGEEEGKTRCVCEFTHDDGYMICCDKCGEWQHVDCMGIDRQNIPDDYMCDRCEPRPIDRKRARSIQIGKREEQLGGLGSSGSDSSSGSARRDRRASPGSVPHRKRTPAAPARADPAPAPGPFSPTRALSGSPPVRNAKRTTAPRRPRRPDGARKPPKRKRPRERRKRKSTDAPNHRSKYGPSSRTSRRTESFELATTNHYSPELRARIVRYASARVDDAPDVPEAPAGRACATVPHAGGKILIATVDTEENSPIVELRGKYMLSAQHGPQPQASGRPGGQRPGPFLFFYRLPRDPTRICIDTRTYGNEARFVRRSCRPNAELRHRIAKGALRVYLVAIEAIPSNAEITIRHDSTGAFQPCACGDPKRCRRAGSNDASDAIPHRNNGAAEDASRERRGRAGRSTSPGGLPAERDRSEPEPEPPPPEIAERSPIEKISRVTVESREPPRVDEKPPPEARPEPASPSPSPVAPVAPPAEEKIAAEDAVEPAENPKTDDETVEREASPASPSSENDGDAKRTEDSECKNPIRGAPKGSVSAKPKDGDRKDAKRAAGSRRASVHSARSTRASVSTNAAESADEKSDPQSVESKTSGKEKKKLTREERKMEAIMKAFERMEKAELRKQENKDRQSRRRESDAHQSNADGDSKDRDDDDGECPKRRRRKKGRSRTVSQTHRNRNRLNSIDSDMVTSGEESASLLSPPLSNSIANNSYSDGARLVSPDDTSSYRPPSLLDSVGLRDAKSNVELSPVCLLVEAAVGPLESTFKFPKTKKDIMNEWLGKSPDRNSAFDGHHGADFAGSGNGDVGRSFVGASPFSEKKSLENIVRAAKSMIGTFGGGATSVDSTPEKNFNAEYVRSDSLGSLGSISPKRISSPPFSQRSETDGRDGVRNFRSPGDKRAPRRFCKNFKSAYGDPFLASRSVSGSERDGDRVPNDNVAMALDESNVIAAPPDEIRDAEILSAPLPPQHSAKKRWLRQAISEESDSPTAESPPNEMVAPLKKRRLARESLSTEPVFGNGDEHNSNTPKKDFDANSQNATSRDGVLPRIADAPSVTKLKSETPEEPPKMEVVPETVPDGGSEIHSKTEKEADAAKKPIGETEIVKSPIKKDDSNSDSEKKLILSDLKFNFSQFSKSKGDLGRIDSKDDACLGSVSCNRDVDEAIISRDIKSEPVSNINSAETSGNSSPVLDDIDDIKKKIHSFHTENIQILKIRNKKQPKEKRKKVNLNFDLCVLADQTIDVKLKSEKESIDENPCTVDVDVKDLMSKTFSEPALRTSEPSGLTPEKNAFDGLTGKRLNDSFSKSTSYLSDASLMGENDGFKCAPLFSGSFKNEPNITASHMPDINVIKNAIDMTTSLDIGLKCNNNIGSVDEYKNVQEILSHVNQMDSRNSLLLSGVLKDTNRPVANESVGNTPPPVNKVFVGRPNDPRLNPPPVEAPKPIRRKLSISEYRRRHSMVSNSSTGENETENAVGNTAQNSTGTMDGSNSGSDMSSSVTDDISLIVGKNIEDSIAIETKSSIKAKTDGILNLNEAMNVNDNSLMDIDIRISTTAVSSQTINANSVNIDVSPKSSR